MKSIALSTALIAGIAAFVFTNNRPLKKEQHIDITTDNGFAVVELFTSEGCSSCPPADELLEEISKQYKQQVYLLGFHVDYWNRLGWKDEFSSADYTARQQQYATVFDKDGVYTPQAIVNGTTEFVGSDKTRMIKEIDKQLSTVVNVAPVINAVKVNNHDVAVNFTVKENTNSIVNVALVQLQAFTDVKNGENEGRKLHHINIVRDLKTLDPTGTAQMVQLTIPTGLTAADCNVIVYAQDKQTLKITGAVSSVLQ